MRTIFDPFVVAVALILDAIEHAVTQWQMRKYLEHYGRLFIRQSYEWNYDYV